MPVFVQVYPAIVILTLSEAEGEESLYFARSTVDTTGKIQGSVRSAQDDGHFNGYTFAGNALGWHSGRETDSSTPLRSGRNDNSFWTGRDYLGRQIKAA